MFRRATGILALSVLVVLVPSCAKLESPGGVPVSLVQEQLPPGGIIPEEWGSLVSVTPVANYPELLQFWFQDRDGNIRLVALDLSRDQVVNVKMIRRK